jgi:PEP-CTERM/exosortase A-associated glycosyltransferase
MKILHILDHSLPLQSGYSFRSQNIFKAQRKRGWDPVIVTSPKHEASWRGNSEREEMIDGFRYYRTGTVSESSFSIAREVLLMRALTKRIEEVIKIEKPDILHAHSPILNGIPALWAGHKLGIPVVYEIRAFWEDAAVDHGTYGQNSWKYKLVKTLEKWVCLKAESVAVLCEGLKEDLIKRGIPFEKIAVVPNAVNPDDFKHPEPDEEFIKKWNLSDKKIIGFIGSFYRYEGLDLLIDAFDRLRATRQDIVLLLVGGGEMEAELRKQIERLHLKEKVIMPGRISHDCIPAIYALTDILAYPRYSMRLTELVTPLKPLEAMAVGKALVASDVGGHRELIRHGYTGLLFPAGNVSSLTDALKCLIEDVRLRQDLQRQGLAWVHHEHNWDKTSAVYEEFYSKTIEKGTVPKLVH